MTTENKSEVAPVKGTSKHIPKAKRHMTVRDVIQRCIKAGEPVPRNYRERDPDEVIAEVEKE